MKLKIGSKSGLKYFSYQDIKSWDPCYDPAEHISREWKGTAIDILRMDCIPFRDRLWCVLRPEITSESVMRLFAVWCARQVLHLMTDPRSTAALKVAERFAVGTATGEEMAAACTAASNAVDGYTGASVWSSAAAAARAAASAARITVSYGSIEAAAAQAAGAAASTTRVAQRDKLIEMLTVEGLERKYKS